jgi:hypothetical protein
MEERKAFSLKSSSTSTKKLSLFSAIPKSLNQLDADDVTKLSGLPLALSPEGFFAECLGRTHRAVDDSQKGT